MDVRKRGKKKKRGIRTQERAQANNDLHREDDSGE